MFQAFTKLHAVDEDFQKVIQEVIRMVWEKFRFPPTEAELLIGGSTVEGAMVSRFFKPTERRGLPTFLKEIEFDLNYLIGTIPREMKQLVQDIDGKPGNVTVKNCDDLLGCIVDDIHREWFKLGQKDHLVDSFRAKESVMGMIKFLDEEKWITVRRVFVSFSSVCC